MISGLGQCYNNSISLYSGMSPAYSGGGGGEGQGVSYSRSNFVGCSGGGVDYTVQ